MANNYGVANTVFKPFSFEDMLKPALMATESLEKLEAEKLAADEAAALSALDFKGSKYEDKFNDYLNSLSGVADYINKGDIQNAKRAIKGAKNMYVNTLVPAQQRIKKLNTLRDKQNAEESANPFVRFSIDYRNKNEDDINNNSDYVSYDLDKIYAKIAKNTIDRISKDYRASIGKPTAIKGTNSIAVTSGYGMTSEEYEAALADPNSDLNKYIKEQISIATDGITNQDIIKEVTQGVKDTIKNNIGKFTTTAQQRPTTSNANYLRKLEFDYKYTKDENGNYRLSDNFIKDQMALKGYILDDDGNWVKPGKNNDLDVELPADRSFNASYSYALPDFKGDSVRIKTFDIDNKLNNKSAYVDVKHEGESRKANKYEYKDILEMMPEGVSQEVLAKLVGGNIDNAAYYDFYYIDESGRGGTIYTELKDNNVIKNIQNERFTNEQRSKAAGIVKVDNVYYFVGSDGRILLDKNKNGIDLSEDEISTYRDILENLENGKIVPITNNSENVAL